MVIFHSYVTLLDGTFGLPFGNQTVMEGPPSDLLQYKLI